MYNSIMKEEDVIPQLPVIIEAKVPEIQDIPIKAQQVLCLVSCGFSKASIARLLDVTDSAIGQLINKHDPEHQFALSKNARRAFLAKLWEARAGEALLHITPDKLEKASVGVLARVAALGSKQMQELDTGDKESKPDPYKMLDKMGRF